MLTVCVCVCVCTQWCIEADTHQVKPVVFYIFSGVECVLAPLKQLVRWLCDQPVVRLSIGGVNNGGNALQVQKHLEECRYGEKIRDIWCTCLHTCFNLKQNAVNTPTSFPLHLQILIAPVLFLENVEKAIFICWWGFFFLPVRSAFISFPKSTHIILFSEKCSIILTYISHFDSWLIFWFQQWNSTKEHAKYS